MILLLVVLAVVIVGGLTGLLVWFAATRPGALDAQTMSEPTSSASHQPLTTVDAAAIDGLRFDQALRGYSMRQVDAVLDAVRDELVLRDEQLATLRRELDAARLENEAARHPQGDPELGHGPVVRAADDASIWSTGVRSYQAGDQPGDGAPEA